MISEAIMVAAGIFLCGGAFYAMRTHDQVGKLREDVANLQRTLDRTMQVNAYFHAKTWATQKGEPEPPRPE
jgi:hypothetical protein